MSAKVVTISDPQPVIATVGGPQAHAEGEMDALLLGRTRVSFPKYLMLISNRASVTVWRRFSAI